MCSPRVRACSTCCRWQGSSTRSIRNSSRSSPISTRRCSPLRSEPSAMRVSPLDALHRRLGARIVPFGGWEMPLEYTGTLVEHMACRGAAAIFDVSHLGTVRVTGDDAFELLQRTLSNDLAKIGWWHPELTGRAPVFDVMPNASNTDRVVAAVGGTDITADRAVLAVQGP